jgi:hypothetical protein
MLGRLQVGVKVIIHLTAGAFLHRCRHPVGGASQVLVAEQADQPSRGHHLQNHRHHQEVAQ